MNEPNGRHQIQKFPACLHTVINHDLPNMVVALNGLLQMLGEEERERMGPAGQEYLDRLSSVAHRLQTTALTLRALNKLDDASSPPEKVSLRELIREAAAVAKSALSGRQIHFHSVLHCTEVTAPRRLLLQMLSEMISFAGSRNDRSEVHLQFTSRFKNDQMEIAINECDGASDSEIDSGLTIVETATVSAEDFPCDKLEDRLRLTLVEELARAAGGRFNIRSSSSLHSAYAITFPRDAHPLLHAKESPA